MERYEFTSQVKYYIEQLKKDPINAVLNDTMKSWGLKNPDFLDDLINNGILKKMEKAVNNGDSKGRDQYELQYKVLCDTPDELTKKIKDLYNRKYCKLNESVFKEEDRMKKEILNDPKSGKDYKERGGLNEDGEGGCDCGDCSSCGEGASSTFSAGDYAYDTSAFRDEKKKKGDSDVVSRGPISVMVSESQMKKLMEFILNEEAERYTAFGNIGYDAPGADTSNKKFWGKAKNHKNMLKDPNLSGDDDD